MAHAQGRAAPRIGCSRSGTISVSRPPRGLKQDWSRQLPVPIKVGRRKLRSLDDIRRHLLSLRSFGSVDLGFATPLEVVIVGVVQAG